RTATPARTKSPRCISGWGTGIRRCSGCAGASTSSVTAWCGSRASRGWIHCALIRATLIWSNALASPRDEPEGVSMWRCPAVAAICALAMSTALAQRGPAVDPVVREGVTVKLGDHTYAIPDGNVGGVPNVGIVVGTRATLVIDPGMGRRSGEAVLLEMSKVSRNSEIYIASTHFHPEHTTGYVAFPASAKYINSRVQ